jgi:transposase-like protein
METVMKPVQNGRGGRRRWSGEQKLAVLQEWKNRVSLEEVCRKYAMNAAQMYRWKRSLDQGLKEPGELVTKSHVLGLQKRFEELERALGRKALEQMCFKKPSSSSDSNYPREYKMVGADHGVFHRLGLSGLGQAAELVLRPAAVRAGMAGEAAGGGSGDWPTPGNQPGVLWLPADPRPTQTPGTHVRSQNRVEVHAPAGLALHQAHTTRPVWAATRRASVRGRTEPALGLEHHGHPSVGRSEGALGDHDRLRGSDGGGLALRHAYHGRGSSRDAAGSDIPAVWGATSPRAGNRVSQRQRAGIHLASIPTVRASHGAHLLPQAPAESGVERVGRGVLRQLQAGLRVSGVPRDIGGGGAAGADPSEFLADGRFKSVCLKHSVLPRNVCDAAHLVRQALIQGN